MNAYGFVFIFIVIMCCSIACIVLNHIYSTCMRFLNDYYDVKIDSDQIEIFIDESIPTDNTVICCICLQDKTDIRLPCTHDFHENCIEKWFHKSLTCPICRENYEIFSEES